MVTNSVCRGLLISNEVIFTLPSVEFHLELCLRFFWQKIYHFSLPFWSKLVFKSVLTFQKHIYPIYILLYKYQTLRIFKVKYLHLVPYPLLNFCEHILNFTACRKELSQCPKEVYILIIKTFIPLLSTWSGVSRNWWNMAIAVMFNGKWHIHLFRCLLLV